MTERDIFIKHVIPASQSITKKSWIEKYTPEKLIISCSNNQKNEWTKSLK